MEVPSRVHHTNARLSFENLYFNIRYCFGFRNSNFELPSSPGGVFLVGYWIFLFCFTCPSSAAPVTPDLWKVPDEKMLKAAWDYNVSAGGQTMVIMHKGKVIFDRYANGAGPLRPQPLASGSKSFVGVAAAAAVQDGLMDFDELACKTLPEWKGDPRKSKITLRQLLNQTDGLEPGENLASPQRTTWEQGVNAPAISDPGTRFRYGPNHFFAFGEILQRKLASTKYRTFQEYLNRRVLAPIGVTVRWMKLSDGNPNLPGGALMTARDWATFGEFIRQGGAWNGTQIIDEKILNECFTPGKASPNYGLTWWLRSFQEDKPNPADAGDLKESAGIIAAMGMGDQRLYIIRSLDLVVVRNARVMEKSSFRDTLFLSALLTNGGPM
jgi:CubicO group peptidase (beta-lactamase class C family)